jgi:hypothetical protein
MEKENEVEPANNPITSLTIKSTEAPGDSPSSKVNNKSQMHFSSTNKTNRI